MFSAGNKNYFVVPRLEQIPRLVHGFGTIKWKEQDFRKKPEWRRFKVLSLKQTHSNIIRVIDRFPEKSLKGDGMLTDCPGIFLVIKTADCLPVLIADELRAVIAAVHCGWRGTAKRVIQKAIQGLKDVYGCNPSSLLVAFGPSIGGNCYEVGEDVKDCFKEKNILEEVIRNHPEHNRKYLFDLKEANRSQLLRLGVKEENIFSIELCTHCDKDLISFRRDKKSAQRMLNFIGLSF